MKRADNDFFEEVKEGLAMREAMRMGSSGGGGGGGGDPNSIITNGI